MEVDSCTKNTKNIPIVWLTYKFKHKQRLIPIYIINDLLVYFLGFAEMFLMVLDGNNIFNEISYINVSLSFRKNNLQIVIGL